MKKLILILLLLSALPVFASRTIVTRNPVYSPHYLRPSSVDYFNRPYSVMNNQNKSDINALEKYIFNRSYTRESDLSRLQRLELQAFGAVQQGDFDTRYENVRAAILSRPKQNYKTSLLNNIGNYFAGQMTGFTPSLNQYGQTFDMYSNPAFEVMPTYGQTYNSGYSSPWGGGYTTRNYGSGSTGSIRILD